MFFLNKAKKKGVGRRVLCSVLWSSARTGCMALHRPVGPLPGVFQPGRAVRGGPPCSLPLAFSVFAFLCVVYVCGAFGGAGSVRGFLSMGGRSHRASVGIRRIPTRCRAFPLFGTIPTRCREFPLFRSIPTFHSHFFLKVGMEVESVGMGNAAWLLGSLL